VKATFDIDDRLMRELKREAAKRGCTVSELVEAGIRLVVKSKKAIPAKNIPPLPKFSMGGTLVDYADRETLYRAMEEEDDDWVALYRAKKK